MNTKEQVKELWRLCFQDSEAFIELYFNRRYTDEINASIQMNEQVVSALQMIPYPMTFAGSTLQTAYISGACTHPDFRGKGIMERLLTESFQQMAKKNTPLSILIPANEGLFDYYARTGYASAFFRTRIEENIPEISNNNENLRYRHTTSFEQDIFEFFTQQAHERNAYVQHTAADFQTIMEDLQIGGGCVTVAYSVETESIRGIVFAFPEEEFLRIGECMYDSEEVRDCLIRKAARHFRQRKIVRFALPNHSTTEEPFGMARIIHAQTILGLYVSAVPELKINIKLTDKQLPFNNGYYHINKGVCSFHNQPVESKYEEMTIGELSALIFNRFRLFMSLMLE